MNTLIVDSLSVCHAAKHVMKSYPLSKDEMRTEVIFVFLQKMLFLAKRFNTSKFIFAWDSQKSYRKKKYPQYKANRDKRNNNTDEVMLNKMAHDQFSVLRRSVLPEMGFANNFIQTGYEGDDLVAAVVQGSPIVDDIIIVSTDTDLHQLLNLTISQYNHVQKKRFFLKDFKEKWGISPEQWSIVKALAGCSSDNIEGIQGVGEKTAIKYLKGELGENTKAFARIKEENDHRIKTNLPLVNLPMEGTIVPTMRQDTLHISKFLSVFKRYDFRSFLKRDKMSQWMEAFKL